MASSYERLTISFLYIFYVFFCACLYILILVGLGVSKGYDMGPFTLNHFCYLFHVKTVCNNPDGSITHPPIVLQVTNASFSQLFNRFIICDSLVLCLNEHRGITNFLCSLCRQQCKWLSMIRSLHMPDTEVTELQYTLFCLFYD